MELITFTLNVQELLADFFIFLMGAAFAAAVFAIRWADIIDSTPKRVITMAFHGKQAIAPDDDES